MADHRPGLLTVGTAPLSNRRFGVALGVITAVALAIRVVYVLEVTLRAKEKLYDAFWYGVTANGFAQGEFFRAPFETTPSAAHPPLTSLLLGIGPLVVGVHRGSSLQRMTMAVIGAAVVLVVGLVGRAVAGPAVGLTAAGLAAVYPNFWIPSGILMSETPAMLCTALALLGTVSLLRNPTFVRAALTGAACGLATLATAQLVLLIPALVIPAALLARQHGIERRLALAGIGVLAAAVVLAPWVGRNLATFSRTTTISTGDGPALLGANCRQAYWGPGLGTWHGECLQHSPSADESVESAHERQAAVHFAENHASRLPVVALARVGRLWDLFEPFQMADVDVNEGRPVQAARAGLFFYYALLPLSVGGIVVYRRRAISQWFLLVPAGVLTISSAIFYGSVRFRAPFEVCLVVLAAPPLVLLARWVRSRTGSAGRSEAEARSLQPTPP